jgi:protein gp37
MGDKTKIEWAGLGLPRGATWNPVVALNTKTGKRGWFCVKKNQACNNCYAERMNQGPWGNGLRFTIPNLTQVCLELRNIDQPLRWRIPRGIFVCSMSDLFGEFIRDDMRNKVMDIVDRANWHRFGLLTKRANGSTLDYLVDRYANRPFPKHIWFGISIGNQAHADEMLWFMQRMRELAGPDVILWVSHGPAIGPVDWSGWEGTINWLATEGESGPRARPMHPDWVRGDRDWCAQNDIAFHFKQWGEYRPFDEKRDPAVYSHNLKSSGWDPETDMVKVGKKHAGRLLDGRAWDEYPVPIDAKDDVV